MLRVSAQRLAGEFTQKSRWARVQPTMYYGRLYLPWNSYRTFPMKSVNWVTRDSNRLVNFTSRYQIVRDELDVAKNEEDLKIPLNDVRWNDNRRMHFNCSTCGKHYRKQLSSMTKYHSMCHSCRSKFPSTVLGAQSAEKAVPLDVTHPQLCDQLVGEKAENLKHFPNSSKYIANWKCLKCGSTFTASIRSRTGVTLPGEGGLNPLATKYHQHCENCRWSENMTEVGKSILQEGGYTGLELSMSETFTPLARPASPSASQRRKI